MILSFSNMAAFRILITSSFSVLMSIGLFPFLSRMLRSALAFTNIFVNLLSCLCTHMCNGVSWSSSESKENNSSALWIIEALISSCTTLHIWPKFWIVSSAISVYDNSSSFWTMAHCQLLQTLWNMNILFLDRIWDHTHFNFLYLEIPFFNRVNWYCWFFFFN